VTQKSESRVPTWSCSGECPSGLQTTTSPCFHTVKRGSASPTNLPSPSVHKSSHCRLRFQHLNLGGPKHSILNRHRHTQREDMSRPRLPRSIYKPRRETSEGTALSTTWSHSSSSRIVRKYLWIMVSFTN
jgi:hypothetical protein